MGEMSYAWKLIQFLHGNWEQYGVRKVIIASAWAADILMTDGFTYIISGESDLEISGLDRALGNASSTKPSIIAGAILLVGDGASDSNSHSAPSDLDADLTAAGFAQRVADAEAVLKKAKADLSAALEPLSDRAREILSQATDRTPSHKR